ncbi:putative hybrid NRPS/PKS enzyme [Triangularia setosa]|uniref:Hybrid NRPS/PKS enzyme n=1 Tax=Triangularia setosa TaxID=2587417 RepID=A0AAN6W8E4_9PEZI|nr:putative hybrid NRPS/PKS enzyme [Podospora setosa]
MSSPLANGTPRRWAMTERKLSKISPHLSTIVPLGCFRLSPRDISKQGRQNLIQAHDDMSTSTYNYIPNPLLGVPTVDPLGLGIAWRNTLSAFELLSLVGQQDVLLPNVFPVAGYAKMVAEASLILSGSRVLRKFELDDFCIQHDITLTRQEDKVYIELELQPTGGHERREDRTDFVNFRIRSRHADAINTTEQLNALGCLRLRSSARQIAPPTTAHYGPGQVVEDSKTPAKAVVLADNTAKEIPGPRIIKTLPMSFGQSGFWFMTQLVADPTFFNGTVTFLIMTKTKLDVEALARIVDEMALQHEGLRTAFFTNPETHQAMQGVLDKSPLRLETKTMTSPAQVRTEIDTMNRHVYDIARGQFLRLLLLSESPTRHHLVVGYHHINIDGMSLMALTEHLRLAYGGQSLPPPFQQNEFSKRQRERLERGQHAEDILFWKTEFQDLPEILPILPLSPSTALRSSRPATRTTYRHVRAERRSNPEITTKLLELRKQGHIQSPFTLYLTVFQILLGRLAQTDDLCIGVASANRQNDAESTDSIGIFLNLFALRLRADLSKSFLELLQENKVKALAGLKHSTVPFDIVLDEVGAVRHPTHSPLFQAFINYIPVAEDRPFGADGTIKNSDYEIGETIYDIMLAVIDPPIGDPWIAIMVQRELYTQQEAQILLDCFMNLMEAFTSDIHLSGRAPQMFSKVAVQDAIKLGQGVTLDMNFGSLIGQLDHMSANHAHQIALRDTLGAEVSYRDMMARSARIAHALFVSSNVAPGSRIGVLQEPTVDWICSMLGIWRVGGSYVPLEVTQGAGRLKTIIRDADLAAVLVHNATRTLCEEIYMDETPLSSSVILDITIADDISGTVSIFHSAKPSDEAIVLYTSGSTGVPKGISLPHRMVANTINGFLHAFPMKPQTVLQQIALSFDVSWWQTLLGLATGGSVFVVGKDARRDPLALTDLIASQSITLTLAVPSEAVSWLQHGVDYKKLRQSSWEYHISAGEAIGPNLVDLLRDLRKPNLRFINAYGPAETIVPHAHEVPLRNPDLAPVIPIGKVLPNYSVYIIDQDNHPLPAGVPGQIVIGGAGVASGYIKQPELTAARFPKDTLANARAISNGWTHAHLSGDRGYMREDGVFVTLGRMNGDTQIKLRGQRFELREVEAALVTAGNGDILEAVCHIRHGGDEKDAASAFLVAHVVLSSEAQRRYGITGAAVDSRLREIVTHLATLPQYMRPSVVVSLPSMPLSYHGKVDRKFLSKAPLKGEESRIPSTNPRRPETRTKNPEKTLKLPGETKSIGQRSSNGRAVTTSLLRDMEEIWREVLGDIVSRSQLDQNSDFFLVGGNSLLLIKVKSKIKERTGHDIPLLDLFQGSTLGKMAAVIPTMAVATPQAQQPAKAEHRSDTQEKMKQIWVSVLGAIVDENTVGPDSDFFLVGGNSLLLIGIQREVNKAFGILLPLPKLFETNTLAKMSTLLDTTLTAARTTDSFNTGAINWEDEVAFKEHGPVIPRIPHHLPPVDITDITIVLTGATGFLGQHILHQLLPHPLVKTIHCIAVRNASKFPPWVIDSPKITIHPGDLRDPTLGLSPQATHQIFSPSSTSPTTNKLVVIHNGADINFLRPYPLLRPANLLSTKTLVRLTLKLPNPASFHYISTAGVSQLGKSDLYEQPLSLPHPPDPSTANGYLLSKYASEQYLHHAHAVTGLEIVVHRPSYIVGDDAPQLDIMHNILFYSQNLQIVPKMPSVERWLQFVGVEEVARDVAADVLDTKVLKEVHYRNHCGKEVDWVRLDQLGGYLTRKHGARFEEVESGRWLELAERAGMPGEVGGYLSDLMGRNGGDSKMWVIPRVLKGTRGARGGWRRRGKL